MTTKIEVVFHEGVRGMTTVTLLERDKSGYTDMEVFVMEGLKKVIFSWLEDVLKAHEVINNQQSTRGNSNVHRKHQAIHHIPGPGGLLG